MTKLLGGVEAGGTKFVCAVGTGPSDIHETRFATTSPEETLQRVLAFFSPYKPELAALGIGAFGPLDLRQESPTYGFITSTPKPGWQNTDIAGVIARELQVPVALDTDVNAAALAEGRWGAARGLSDYLYITVGTGIGGGIVSGGRLVHGLVHPELGHCLLPKHPDDTFAGSCPYHGDRCFEGLASGPALAARWGCDPAALPADHHAWDIQAFYMGVAIANCVCTLSPQRVILGGGVMAQSQMLGKVQTATAGYLNGYVRHPAIEENIESYIVLPELGSQAGVAGALALAGQKIEEV
ncbi:ROK family protein [Teredinibacter turnerae]|uniref:ROK family protein n=1 Tax=Teredinibacter turnerae TaxID=2426 RepID=UPI00035E8EC2|nr:ROK family protein [Teredinibacter turnerae]